MTPERLAYWYFRLNGFLTIENFVVHPDTGTEQRTDADLIAVRLWHRQENAVLPMEDDPKVADCDALVNVIIAEIKRGACSLNGPWTDSEQANMQRVLRAIGCVPLASLQEAASALYEVGGWSGGGVTVRLFAVGEFRDMALPIPNAQQVTWDEIIDFCIQRFRAYRRQKASVGLWESDGRRLKRLAESSRPDRAAIREIFRLRDMGESPQVRNP